MQCLGSCAGPAGGLPFETTKRRSKMVASLCAENKTKHEVIADISVIRKLRGAADSPHLPAAGAPLTSSYTSCVEIAGYLEDILLQVTEWMQGKKGHMFSSKKGLGLRYVEGVVSDVLFLAKHVCLMHKDKDVSRDIASECTQLPQMTRIPSYTDVCQLESESKNALVTKRYHGLPSQKNMIFQPLQLALPCVALGLSRSVSFSWLAVEKISKRYERRTI